ncbi:ComEC/Rec2 family competence protein [Occallatibacter savannae]|uniref:ComEC/Rec2 family competence protein n=1 Tax=Occallatibacter savannae TaxID=1002691 RepID=UPI0013A56891|nr:MBL fold metallo-hydrolase [Occallatibacter savannae]
MNRTLGSLLVPFLLVLASANIPAHAASAKNQRLLIYSIDVEGGQATLLVSPSGASMLVDTGWPGSNGRDAERIETAMKDAGIHQIDKVLITHFHTDHVGGVPELVKRVKVGEFLDHGVNREDSDITRKDFAAYIAAIGNTPRHTLHPGDAIKVPGLDVIVVTADGEHVASVPGIKPEANPSCASEPKWTLDQSENPRSVGILVRFGKFSFLDLGDLTKPKELDLVCPNSPLGHVSLFLASHHGLDQSNSKSLVDSIHARAAIMNNGAHKGGSPTAWQSVSESVGAKNLFMLHTAEGSDTAHNSAEDMIANPRGDGEGHYFKVAADRDGSFTVTNTRTGATKKYPAD